MRVITGLRLIMLFCILSLFIFSYRFIQVSAKDSDYELLYNELLEYNVNENDGGYLFELKADFDWNCDGTALWVLSERKDEITSLLSKGVNVKHYSDNYKCVAGSRYLMEKIAYVFMIICSILFFIITFIFYKKNRTKIWMNHSYQVFMTNLFSFK